VIRQKPQDNRSMSVGVCGPTLCRTSTAEAEGVRFGDLLPCFPGCRRSAGAGEVALERPGGLVRQDDLDAGQRDTDTARVTRDGGSPAGREHSETRHPGRGVRRGFLRACPVTGPDWSGSTNWPGPDSLRNRSRSGHKPGTFDKILSVPTSRRHDLIMADEHSPQPSGLPCRACSSR